LVVAKFESSGKTFGRGGEGVARHGSRVLHGHRDLRKREWRRGGSRSEKPSRAATQGGASSPGAAPRPPPEPRPDSRLLPAKKPARGARVESGDHRLHRRARVTAPRTCLSRSRLRQPLSPNTHWCSCRACQLSSRTPRRRLNCARAWAFPAGTCAHGRSGECGAPRREVHDVGHRRSNSLWTPLTASERAALLVEKSSSPLIRSARSGRGSAVAGSIGVCDVRLHGRVTRQVLVGRVLEQFPIGSSTAGERLVGEGLAQSWIAGPRRAADF
jgi:hypothetical protein